MDKSAPIGEVCKALSGGDRRSAAAILSAEYPFVAHDNAGRNFTKAQSLGVFVRDGFVDRYSGERLVFPGVLRLLSFTLPDEFPFHPNWKADACHFGYYELQPTVDHEIPVTRGGRDDCTNWVTTSALRNMAKSNFLLSEIGWAKHPAGNFAVWNGLTTWYLDYMNEHRECGAEKYLVEWMAVAKLVLREVR